MNVVTKNPDPVAALVGAGIGIASLFGVFTYLGWNADQVGQFGGFSLMIVSSIRTLVSRRARNVAPTPDPLSPFQPPRGGNDTPKD